MTNITILNSSFIQNSASLQGGALAINTPTFLIQDSTFIENQATLSGGAIYTNLPGDLNTFISENNLTFSQNSVTYQYGDNVASDPLQIDISFNTQDLTSQMAFILPNTLPITIANISTLGLQQVEIQLTIIDKYDQVVIDSTSPQIVYMYVDSSLQSRTFTYFDCVNGQCLFTPSDIQLSGLANETVSVRVVYESPLVMKQVNLLCHPSRLRVRRN